MVLIEIPPTLHHDALRALDSGLRDACRQGEVAVLRGSVERFCDGMDLEALKEMPERRASAAALFAEVLIGLRFAPVPVIAVVEGSARGGGLGLVAAADWVIAAPTSQYSLPELSLGLLPATVMPLLLERTRPIAAQQLALRATAITATEAYRVGLVDEIVDDAEFHTCIRHRARQLRRGSSTTIASLKRLCASDHLERALRAGAAQTARDLCRPEIVDPIREFLAGGAPPWSRT